MKKKLGLLIIASLAVLAAFTLSASLGRAQQGTIERGDSLPEEVNAQSNYIPIQGMLTNTSGTPLDGTYTVSFRIYDIASGGTALCEDLNNVLSVEEGLFNAYINIYGCSAFDGRQLYLGIQVDPDPEMTPRSFIDNVPYALSLHPGAVVKGSLSSSPILDLENAQGAGISVSSTDGIAMNANSVNNYGIWALSQTGTGIHGAGVNGAGVEGYSLLGPGISGESMSGAAIEANGRIVSSEDSYLWISGNDVLPYGRTDTTLFDLNSQGGVRIQSGTTGNVIRNVVLPITIVGTLYGQDVRLSELEIYWKGSTPLDAISTIRLRRQTGVCSTCYVEIRADTADHTCWYDTYPQGCTISNALSTGNVLSENSGILYLTMELIFNNTDSWFDFGGARLTLEYND